MNYKRLEPVFFQLDSVDSTNTYAAKLLKEGKPLNGTAVLTKRQILGKGQRGNSWLSDPDLNLTFSVIVYPGISTERVYFLNMVTSLAVLSGISTLSDQVTIKWPNDILVGTKKIAGILIENQFRGEQISSSILGIGVNINQVEFGPGLNATSLKVLTEKDYSIDQIFESIYGHLDFYLNILMEQNFGLLSKLYRERLFGLEQERFFSDSSGRFSGIIKGVDEDGLLMILRKEGLKKYDLKEVRFEL